MPLSTYWNKLHYHDWFYQMSDDSYWYHKGRDEELEITNHRHDSPEHFRLFHEWLSYVFDERKYPILCKDYNYLQERA